MKEKRLDAQKRWAKLIEEQAAGQQNQSRFCKERGLSVAQFKYYKKNLSLNTAQILTPQNFEKLFSPVHFKKPEIKPSLEIQVILPNGFKCLLPLSTEINQIKKIMEALLSC
jgi:hypothetical protein